MEDCCWSKRRAGYIMQSIKTKMDWHIQESLMVEVYKADPENITLNKFMNMQNHHGAAMRKIMDAYKKNGHQTKYTDDELC